MILDRFFDLFRGEAITIPPMDGALKPNILLEEAESVVEYASPDNVVRTEKGFLFSSDSQVLEFLGPGKSRVVMAFDSQVTALAKSLDGKIAVGLDSGQVIILQDGSTLASFEEFKCPVALTFENENAVTVCEGSAKYRPSDWIRDLMEQNMSGSVWRADIHAKKRICLADDLAFPFGIACDQRRERLIVSESWRHRLLEIPLIGGSPRTILDKLPGYPCRIVSQDDGFILCLFAPRNRLIEFVLKEDNYREAMMREIDPHFWIAPSLSSSKSFLEPLQNGGVRTMGIHKPWSPSRSYGLVVMLDSNAQPLVSFHSRANGTRHGITSAAAMGSKILASSKGGDLVLAFDADMGRK